MLNDKDKEELRKLGIRQVCDFKINMMLQRTMLTRELLYVVNKDDNNDLLLAIEIQKNIDKMQMSMDFVDSNIKWQKINNEGD